MDKSVAVLDVPVRAARITAEHSHLRPITTTAKTPAAHLSVSEPRSQQTADEAEDMWDNLPV